MTDQQQESHTGRFNPLVARVETKLIIVCGCAVALVLLGYVLLRGWVRTAAEAKLTQLCKVPVKLGNLRISWLDDMIELTNVEIGQPKGFSSGPMIAADQVRLSGWRSLVRTDKNRIRDVRILEPDIDLVTNAEGKTNIAEWIGGFFDSNEPEGENKTAADKFSALVERMVVDSFQIDRSDYSIPAGDHKLVIERGRLELFNLAVGPWLDSTVGRLRGSCDIRQPETVNARLSLAARFGPVGTGNTTFQGSARLTGALYRTFIPVIPSTTDLILGGKGFDLDLDLNQTGDVIAGNGLLVTSNGSVYPFQLSGSVDDPVFELPEKLDAVTSRISGSSAHVVVTTLTSGREIVAGAAESAKSFGQGAVKATTTFFRGLGQAAKGWLTEDEELKDSGIEDMTSDTTDYLVNAVSESADTIGEAGARITEALRNDTDFQSWMTEISDRHDASSTRMINEFFQSEFSPEAFIDQVKAH